TKERKKLATILLDYDFVQNIEMDVLNDEYIDIRTSDPDKFYCLIPEIAVDYKLEIFEMTSPDAGLEAVFEYLTRGW
ncbi:MAG: hypothetical protein KAJ76_09290, partial [Candidatus Heimdallarchaeota archaeon]|nr:hypothetical protein [Candidatus Heimdallarchaeota archaeon]